MRRRIRQGRGGAGICVLQTVTSMLVSVLPVYIDMLSSYAFKQLFLAVVCGMSPMFTTGAV